MSQDKQHVRLIIRKQHDEHLRAVRQKMLAAMREHQTTTNTPTSRRSPHRPL